MEQLPQLAFVDWLGFSLRQVQGESLDWLFEALSLLLYETVSEPLSRGWNGYAYHARIGDELGVVAWGGAAQRDTVHVELTGTACRRIQDWDALAAFFADLDGWITRIDLAHDDFTGAVVSIEAALDWFDGGGFTGNGRPPKTQIIGDWIDNEKGRSFYVGSRGNKLCRVYEKGKQLGKAGSPWCRVEVEWRNRNRLLPWDMLTQPGPYLAGAYPCLQWLAAVQAGVQSTQRTAALSLEHSIEHGRRQVGRLITALLELSDNDPIVVVDTLRRPGWPKRLRHYRDVLPNVAGLPPPANEDSV